MKQKIKKIICLFTGHDYEIYEAPMAHVALLLTVNSAEMVAKLARYETCKRCGNIK